MQLSDNQLLAIQRRLGRNLGYPDRQCSTVIYINAASAQHTYMPPWLNALDTRMFNFTVGGKYIKQTMSENRILVLAVRHLGKSMDELEKLADGSQRRLLTMQEATERGLLREWQALEEAKQAILPEHMEVVHAFFKGFTDVTGNWWCGQCYSQYLFMNIGKELDYPELWASETEPSYANWLHTAKNAGCVAVESGLRLARRIQMLRGLAGQAV
jgi:hypothetical protein